VVVPAAAGKIDGRIPRDLHVRVRRLP
jgi:hypothetical protein